MATSGQRLGPVTSVHLTETCEENQIHVITNVETTIATVPDSEVTASVHEALAEQTLLPDEHLVDAGYVDADLLVSSQREHHVRLIGPVREDIHGQVREGKGYDISCFSIDWQQQTVTCPQGCRSSKWVQTRDRHDQQTVHVRFRHSDCTPCPSRSLCTKAKKDPRELSLRPEEEHLALQAARKFQQTDAFLRGIREARWHRRNDCTGNPSIRPTPGTLSGFSEDTSPRPFDRRGYQFGPF